MPPPTPIGSGTAPAAPAPGAPTSPAPATPASDAAGAPAGSSNFDALLATERAARIAAEQRYTELQRLNSRQAQELGSLRRSRGPTTPPAGSQPSYGYDPYADPGNGGEPAPAAPARSALLDDPIYEADRKRREISEFRFDHSLPREQWEAVLQFVSDPLKAGDITFRDDYGRIDYYRSYKAALREIENQQFRAARDRATNPAAGAAGEPSQFAPQPGGPARTAAMLSGSTATTVPEPLDLRTATANDILMKGGVQYDPNDPPSALRR